MIIQSVILAGAPGFAADKTEGSNRIIAELMNVFVPQESD